MAKGQRMSGFHNSPEGERLALAFHKVCAAVGIIHIGLGLLIFGWHMMGARDHKSNLERLQNDSR
jgi:hypothetical protein